jgi:hypothetical protein
VRYDHLPNAFLTYMDNIDWPVLYVRSQGGSKRHVLRERPYPNGDWNTLCRRNVDWSVERAGEAPEPWCSWCLGSARFLVGRLDECDLEDLENEHLANPFRIPSVSWLMSLGSQPEFRRSVTEEPPREDGPQAPVVPLHRSDDD